MSDAAAVDDPESAAPDEAPADETPTREDLQARVDVLEAENDRLRELYEQSRRVTYRLTAFALAGVGLLGIVGAAVFPDVRSVLLVLGAIGLFGGVLTAYLTPEQFVAADLAERVYEALADNEADVVADLGLSSERVYVPHDETATLFVPQDDADPLPSMADIEGPLVVTDETKGLALEPTGATLFDEFERTLAGPLAESPAELAAQVTDALVETFEFVRATEVDVDADDGRLTVGVWESTYQEGFDTPPASIVAVAMAVGLDTPVRAEITPGDDETFVLTCRWDATE